MDFKQLGALFGGGMSGMGKGMMNQGFRSAFEAGQGGMYDLYQGTRVRDFMVDRLNEKNRLQAEKEAAELKAQRGPMRSNYSGGNGLSL